MNKPLDEFDFFDPEVVKDPFEFYDRLRDEAPVYQIPGTQIFLITQHADVKKVARRHKIFSSEFDRMMQSQKIPDEVSDILAQGYPSVNTMLTRDPPAHHRYRALVNPSFSQKRVETLLPQMEQIVSELLDNLPDSGPVDFRNEFCVRIPVWVIADALGVPREDLDKFRRWVDAAVSRISMMATPEKDIYNAKQQVEFQHYFAARIEERRDNPTDDVVSNLVHARIDGELPLDVPEMLSIIQQILVAGSEATTAMLAAGMVHLIQRPDILERLRDDPSLVPTFVEEILRLETPSAGMWRVVLEDTEIHGVAIPKGSQAMIRWAAGNRDAAVFDDANSVDLDRENISDHLAFGYGIHMCLGMFLARQELKVAFTQILKRLKGWKLAEGHEDLTYVPSVLLRGLGELHLEIVKA